MSYVSTAPLGAALAICFVAVRSWRDPLDAHQFRDDPATLLDYNGPFENRR